MRILVALVVGATAILGGCAETPKPSAMTGAIPQQDWILIAPPDNTVTVAFLDTFEYLPGHRDRFPGHTNGLGEQDRRSLESLFEQVAAEPSPEGRLRLVTEVSALTSSVRVDSLAPGPRVQVGPYLRIDPHRAGQVDRRADPEVRRLRRHAARALPMAAARPELPVEPLRAGRRDGEPRLGLTRHPGPRSVAAEVCAGRISPGPASSAARS